MCESYFKNVKLMTEKVKEEPCNVSISAGVHVDRLCLQWFHCPWGSDEGVTNTLLNY
jgi:hypothetical protein